MSTGIIIGMAVATIAGAVTEGILNTLNKQTEAQYVALTTRGLLIVTALTTFAKVIKSIKTLG